MFEEIIAGNGYVHPIKQNGNTIDIVKGIMDADKCGVPYVEGEAPKLRANSIYQTCENIYRFVRDNIPYNEDKEGEQLIQSPGELWNNRYRSKGGTGAGGDCKSMSMFCSALLKAMGIYDFKYRFVSEIPDEDLYHVYIIVKDDFGEGYIILDCTLDEFDKELTLAKLMDVDPAPIGAVCPFPGPAMGRSLIGGQYIFDTTIDALENQGEMWSAHENAYRTTALPQAEATIRGEMIAEIRAKFASQPLKRDKTAEWMGEEYGNFLRVAALMIYHFWGDTSLEMGDFAGKTIPQLSEVDIRIGATEINIKQQVGRDLYDDLKEIGLSDATLKKLIGLSVWYNHSVTMDYMLYRCYNKLTYGQEWGTIPGVPFYDANTKIFYPNGASFNDFLSLAYAFPLEGGTGKPWGLPYVSRGIFIMTNGATDAAVKALTDQIDRVGWNDFINTRIFPGGTTDWLSQQVDEPKALRSTTVYYNWLQGHLPVLYSNPVISTMTLEGYTDARIILSGPRIGAIEQGVIALVVAIAAAVSAIVTAIFRYLASLKSKQELMQQHPAIAPIDFRMQYQTADGCYIGYSSNCASGVAKKCGNEIICNPNLTLPENSPPASYSEPGCMDPASPYYDPLATVDDGSCVDGAPKRNWLLYGGIGLAVVGTGLLLLGDENKK